MAEDKERKLNFIDVSGLGNSGKSAVVDLLREFKTFYVPHYSFEFDLFRLPGGLVDLYQNTSERWTPIRSHFAYFEFKNLVEKLAGSNRRKSLKAFFFSTGAGYESVFQNQFLYLSIHFLDSLVLHKYKSFWPYNLIYDNPLNRALKKIFIKFKINNGLFSEVYLIHAVDFSKKCTTYVNNLFRLKIDSDKYTVVMNNMIEPFQSYLGLDILENSKLIIVIRDPRDIYVSGKTAGSFSKEDSELQAFDNNGYNKSFLATDDLQAFVLRQKLYFEQMYKKADPRIHVVQFESFILDHENEKSKLFKFLNVEAKDHQALTYFNPENSKKNIGLFKRYSRQDEIAFISQELKEYLFDFDQKRIG